MFKLAPAVWSKFPWGHVAKKKASSSADCSKEDLAANPEFVAFARNFMSMLDLAIDMLGPDLDFVEGQLQELGIIVSRSMLTQRRMGHAGHQQLKVMYCGGQIAEFLCDHFALLG